MGTCLGVVCCRVFVFKVFVDVSYRLRVCFGFRAVLGESEGAEAGWLSVVCGF